MVQDRGNIKWSSMMLPEHAELLKTMWAEDKKEARPLLDEQEKERLNEVIGLYYKNQKIITVSVYHNDTISNYSGVIKKIDEINQKILLHNGEKYSICLMDIVDAR
ncbi:YolD-like family protein [Virgibacillus sp. SK37]|uniref:YolD-like family protein n=1 Tax=Virgibacillus sp. SK37 TaxID=403957 RepID=UPI0004D0CB9A|nr:YolD-like family protein [Virgibacillus sp. SK37]AIF43625.1 hypothetical protein X953_11190 [Virgibacillus sp. SK37]